jgi:hypothetical protein
MAELYYVARGNKKVGPFSAMNLRAFAAHGRLLPTDTVWKEGMATAVQAAKVKNLFPSLCAPAPSPEARSAGADGTPSLLPLSNNPPPLTPDVAAPSSPSTAQSEVAPTPANVDPPLMPLETHLAAPDSSAVLGATEEAAPSLVVPEEKPPPRPPEPTRKRRAVGIKGAIVMGQDGYYVQYRKQCFKCGFEDACRSTMLIGNGVTRATFFCVKCRKMREVLIQGMML